MVVGDLIADLGIELSAHAADGDQPGNADASRILSRLESQQPAARAVAPADALCTSVVLGVGVS